MRVLIVGTRWYGRITESVAKAVRATGHRTDVIRYRPWLTFDLARDAGRAARLNADLRRAIGAVRPDLVLLLKAEFVSPETVRAAKKRGARVCSWWFDDPRPWTGFMALFPLLDHFFIWDPEYVLLLKGMGGGRVSYLALGFDPASYRPARVWRPARWDVTFVGTPYLNRLRVLERLRHLKMRILGPGWKKFAPGMDGHIFSRRATSAREACSAYWQSAVVLNVHHPQSVAGANQRVFEIAGSGGFQLVDELSSLRDLFVPGEELVTFRSAAEARRKIEYYLDRPEERRQIADRGARRAHRDHTYGHRVRQMLNLLTP